MTNSGLQMSRRIRRTPFTDKAESHGVSGFTVVNHTLLPKGYQKTVEEDYWHLREHVQIWDVACQRQVEIAGPDAAKLTQMLTPRDLRSLKVGQCFYVPIIDDNAGMINDPVLLKLANAKFWLSVADSDLLLWVKGLAVGFGLDVEIFEPDVSPLAVQGPKAEALMTDIFGDQILDIPFFGFKAIRMFGNDQVVARSGYSKQGGFEIYLHGSHFGNELWDLIWKAGEPHNIWPGSPNLIERIEGGLMSYGNEFNISNNPLECGFEHWCCFTDEVSYIGKEALKKILLSGPVKKICGIKFDGPKTTACTVPYKVFSESMELIGEITSAIYSPRLATNVGLGMLKYNYTETNQAVLVSTSPGKYLSGTVSKLPFDKRS
tara:strand:- start:1400 stop:2527 length:1128 start_codon:yes stop_codon:yes gene_type:complete